MRTSVLVVVAILALACLASAQPPKRANATAVAGDDAPVAPKRNATIAGAKNATATAKANKTASANATDEPAEPKAPAAAGAKDNATKEAPAASPAPKKSGAAVATTGFAAAVAGSVLLLQLVM